MRGLQQRDAGHRKPRSQKASQRTELRDGPGILVARNDGSPLQMLLPGSVSCQSCSSSTQNDGFPSHIRTLLARRVGTLVDRKLPPNKIGVPTLEGGN